ncbi:hypothetical protein I4U23_000245 [Adineta vaga]|nr:hypothetical protein I4U23_000245 [Adineta vaga]
MISSFDKDIILPQSMRIHFIEVRKNAPPESGLIFKIVPIDRRPTTIYWKRPYHIAFVELSPNHYYLITAIRTYLLRPS